MQADRPENHQDDTSGNKKLLWLGILLACLLHIVLIGLVVYFTLAHDRKVKASLHDSLPMEVMLLNAPLPAPPAAEPPKREQPKPKTAKPEPQQQPPEPPKSRILTSDDPDGSDPNSTKLSASPEDEHRDNPSEDAKSQQKESSDGKKDTNENTASGNESPTNRETADQPAEADNEHPDAGSAEDKVDETAENPKKNIQSTKEKAENQVKPDIARPEKTKKSINSVDELLTKTQKKKKSKATEAQINKKYITRQEASKKVAKQKSRHVARKDANQVRGAGSGTGDYSAYMNKILQCMKGVINFTPSPQQVQIEVYLDSAYRPRGTRVLNSSGDYQFNQQVQAAAMRCRSYAHPPAEVRSPNGIVFRYTFGFKRINR